MTELDAMPWWAAVTVSFLLVLGGLIALIGTLGLLRLKSFYQRIHGPAITITLGTGCILIASMVYFTVAQSRLVIHEILIAVFVLMTAPVVTMLIMRAAVYRTPRTGTEFAAQDDAPKQDPKQDEDARPT
ncbi:monovalent cation/H(+) antiporter subunit G [Aromatoleum toluclasticum]|uniref:monovalent cation/H(+) antiporter subunit G n=1 Tax=Aromatoleum toluclasticum TaxID=92003 RepID=UPI00036E3604|nr:monovalent cation/H(+) antiporter subunit G [Aromatoleum toluclasticum]